MDSKLSKTIKQQFIYCFIFTSNLQKVLLIRRQNKVSGILEKIPFEVQVDKIASAICEGNYKLHIQPSHWNPVCDLINLDKTQICYVFMTVLQNIENAPEGLELVDVNTLPKDCIFNNYWLIPLCLDQKNFGPLSQVVLTGYIE